MTILDNSPNDQNFGIVNRTSAPFDKNASALKSNANWPLASNRPLYGSLTFWSVWGTLKYKTKIMKSRGGRYFSRCSKSYFNGQLWQHKSNQFLTKLNWRPLKTSQEHLGSLKTSLLGLKNKEKLPKLSYFPKSKMNLLPSPSPSARVRVQIALLVNGHDPS